MVVKDVMSKNPVTLTQTNTAIDAARLMSEHDIGAVPVVDGANVCGMVTDRDIVLRCVAEQKDAGSCQIRDIMTSSATCVTPYDTLSDAMELMSHYQVRRLPVVGDGRIEGIVTLADIARVRSSSETAQALTDISMP